MNTCCSRLLRSRPPRPVLRALAALLGPAGFALLAAAPLGSQAAGPLLVGVLRADGVAVPYAAYERGRWSRLPWDSVPDAVALHDGPWYQVRAHAPDRRLRGGSVVRFTGPGDLNYEAWGVITDFAPRRLPDPQRFPVARAGAVLSRPHPAVAFEPLPPGAPEGRRLFGLLAPEFERREAQQLAGGDPGVAPDRARLGHPRARSARAGAPLRLVRAYRTEAPVNGRGLFYAVLRRTYPPFVRGNTYYGPRTVLGAWVGEERGRLRLFGAALQLDTESEMQVSVAEPFVALAFGGRAYVLAEFSGYESTERTVLEVGPAGAARVLPPTFSAAAARILEKAPAGTGAAWAANLRPGSPSIPPPNNRLQRTNGRASFGIRSCLNTSAAPDHGVAIRR